MTRLHHPPGSHYRGRGHHRYELSQANMQSGGRFLRPGNDNVPDVTAFHDPDGDHVAHSRETTMWNVLMVGYWACVAIPLMFLCAGMVAALRGVRGKKSDAHDR